MKEVYKHVNETEAENQVTKENSSTHADNQNGSNSSDKKSNETVKEENNPYPEGYGNGTAENSGLRWKLQHKSKLDNKVQKYSPI